MKSQTWMSAILCAGLTCSASADIPDVKKDSGVPAYSATGGDLSPGPTVNDGDSLLVVVGISGPDVPGPAPQRAVNSVTMRDAAWIGQQEPDIPFIQVSFEDSPVWDTRVEIWKFDNKRFEPDGPDTDIETAYDTVVIDFPDGNDRTYAYVFVLDNQDTVDILRKFASDQDSGGTIHDVNPFVLEPDAMIISAHMYANASGGILSCSGNRTEDWNNVVAAEDEGFFVQHATPNAAANTLMKATTNLAGDSITCAVVIRAGTDIVHTPAGSPGTVGDQSTAGWWGEGLTATTVGVRDDISSFGDYMTTGEYTWLRQDICNGNSANDNLEIGDKSQGFDLDPMDFSPLNPNRERDFEKYREGLEENLDDTLSSTG